ncbi:aldose 1-epimerase [Seonamhaeicola sp. MEBiC1930]|uniref:aldose 1-epimerase n=1 Tax=Seonamhaeicola sp. MEBiC01930 TaxID=2976768 RepID=UPI0032508DC9
MYSINQNKKLNTLEIENPNHQLYAKICLDKGACLFELTLSGHEIIKDLSPLDYANTYASSILFPFANRIKDGKYSFENKAYQFEINEPDNNNALHGLVFNKTFEIVNIKTNKDSASIKLEYNETNKCNAFPYTYNIQLEYIFSKENFDLNVTVKNTDIKKFPFTVGWHPYFVSNNLFDSSIEFNSSKKIVLDNRCITTGITDTATQEPIKIGNQQLDDCWILNSDKVVFKTPKYNLTFNATGDNNFLQIYTPPKENTIAIEPTTGVSDSFNNEIGLQVLKANDSYNITWCLKID